MRKIRKTPEQRYLVRVERGRPWRIVTPEGVPLDFVLASPVRAMAVKLAAVRVRGSGRPRCGQRPPTNPDG